jgi:putative FmdB family regulatory protein
MPTYTYRCSKCGAESEVVQSMSDPPLKRCKVCRGALRRTYQSVGIVLKGAGFHRNDYAKPRKSDGDGEPKSDQNSEKNSEKTTEKKSDTTEKKGKTESKTKTESASSDTKKASSDS